MTERPPAPAPPFVNRAVYRRRRLTDAARMLPVLGVLLFMLPLLWVSGSTGDASTARTGLFIFTAWAVLIVAARAIAFALSRPDPEAAPDGQAP